MTPVNVWIREDNPQSSDIAYTCEAEFADKGRLMGSGLANGWINIHGGLPEHLISKLEYFGIEFGFKVSRGFETPDYIVENHDT